MATVRAWTTPKTVGQKLTSAEANDLNDKPMARGGANQLLDDMSVDLGDYNLFVLNAAGEGRLDIDADFLDFSGSGYPTLAARTLTDYTPPIHVGTNDLTVWVDKGLYWEAASANVNKILYYQITLPVDVEIESVTCYLMNPSATGLPANMPQVGIGRRLASSTSASSFASATDSSGTLGVYQALHAVTVSSINHVVESGYDYYIFVTDEYGAGSGAGLRSYRPVLSVTITSLRAL